MMDSNSWRPNQGTEPTINTSDWRTQLQPDFRQRMVNKIMHTLKGHLPVSGQEGLQEFQKIAERFEEKSFTAATSPPDYLRKISLKMVTMETKMQNIMTNNMPPNQVGPNNQPRNQGDWRTQLQPDSRQRIVSEIMDSLKRHCPVPGQEELQELQKIAHRVEENIFTAATSQSDYVSKIALKWLIVQTTF